MLLMRKHGAAIWQAPQVTAYTNEEALETLIAESPHLLPGSANTTTVVVRQLTLPVGYVDMVSVDIDGEISIVECKLKKNPEIRREVVGQVLAYASALWRLTFEDFDRAFSAKSGASLVQRVAQIAGPDWDEEIFRSQVTANLELGRFRLIIVVDEITDELKSIVLYLNQHTSPSLQMLALEIGYIADHGVEIIIPTTYGEEITQEKSKPVGQGLDANAVLTALASLCTPEGLQAARSLYKFGMQHGAIFNPSKGKLPTASARIAVGGTPIAVFGIAEWPPGQAGCTVYFSSLASAGISPAALSASAEKMREIPGAEKKLAGLEQSGFKMQPTIPLDIVIGDANVAKMESALAYLFTAIVDFNQKAG